MKAIRTLLLLLIIFNSKVLSFANNNQIFNDWILVKIETPHLKNSEPYSLSFTVLSIHENLLCEHSVLKNDLKSDFSIKQGKLDSLRKSISLGKVSYTIDSVGKEVMIMSTTHNNTLFTETYLRIDETNKNIQNLEDLLISKNWELHYTSNPFYYFNFTASNWNDKNHSKIAIQNRLNANYRYGSAEKWSIVYYKEKPFLTFNKYQTAFFQIVSSEKNRLKTQFYNGISL